MGLDAWVEKRRHKARLEGIKPIVGGRMRVLRVLRIPSLLFNGLRRALLFDQIALIVTASHKG